MMLRKMMSLAVAAMMLQGSATADWADDFMCGNVWVAGEALLLRPSGDYPYSVIRGPAASATVPTGDQLAVCPSYEWGYKVEVGYRNCDKEILVNWLSFNNGYKNRFSFSDQQQIWLAAGGANITGPGTFVAREIFHYDVLDAEVTALMHKECSKFTGRLFAGLRYARIVNNDSADVIIGAAVLPDFDFDRRVSGRSDFQGTGPRAGLGGRWDVWCNIGLTGSVAGHLLIGSAKSSILDEVLVMPSEGPSAVAVRADVKNCPTCRIIPASEVKFGLDWKDCLFCGISGELGVGYQITHYFYGSQSTLFTELAAANAQGGNFGGTNHVHTDPVSFDGWYFRVGLMY